MLKSVRLVLSGFRCMSECVFVAFLAPRKCLADNVGAVGVVSTTKLLLDVHNLAFVGCEGAV